MAWYDENSWVTYAFAPHPVTILITVLVAVLLPVFIHFLLYRSAATSTTPNFLVAGPIGSGKTALITQFETGESTKTHTSVTPSTVHAQLPTSLVADSLKYRSKNDFESKNPKRFNLTDTPGHAKLRHFAFDLLQRKTATPTGIIFVVDAADLTSASGDGSTRLREAALYLHDILLQLQKNYTQSKTSKSNRIPVLIAANKMDLFTALPESMVRSSLEAEITRLRSTRSKGLATVGRANKGEGLESNVVQDGNDDEGDILGGDPSGKFDFSLMNDYNVDISLRSGSVEGDVGVSKWWEWISEQL